MISRYLQRMPCKRLNAAGSRRYRGTHGEIMSFPMMLERGASDLMLSVGIKPFLNLRRHRADGGIRRRFS